MLLCSWRESGGRKGDGGRANEPEVRMRMKLGGKKRVKTGLDEDGEIETESNVELIGETESCSAAD